ncbi:DUF4476 domain-containing protein [Aequorivita ciconiae]|uniref:DUF4476 domain-containing protein n=1 Tax=Aequorivita ciconiae TaxID=2494375 RepID=UPI0013E2E8D5
MVRTLTFEKAKLQMGKDLYMYCVDKKNYFIVYDAFDFDKSKRELAEYISSY